MDAKPGIVCRVKEPERSQRISILEGSLAQVHITITTGSLLTAYALALGADAFQIGLVGAFTALATIGSLLGSQLVGKIGRRKPISLSASVGGRVLWGVLCFLPFVGLEPGAAFVIFLIVILLGNGLVNLSGTAWLSWMTDLVPIERRGRYFGLRNTVLGGIAMAVSFLAGRTYDAFLARGERMEGLAAVFGAAVASSALAGIVLGRQWEPPLRGESPRSLGEVVRQPIANRRFRRLLTFMILWSIATGIAGPFFGAHMIQNLGMSFSTIAIYSILAGSVNLVTQPLWGRVIDRVGNRPVLAFNLVGVFLLPLFWLLATPDRLWPIWTDAVLTGLFWPGYSLAGFNLVLATAPEENRSAYLGVQAMAVGIATFLAALAGGWAARLLSGFSAEWLGVTLVNFHILFAVSSVLRIALLPMALRLRESGARPVAALVTLVGDKVSQIANQAWQAGIATVRRMGNP